MGTSSIPVAATYRIAGPASWARTFLAPLFRVLASAFPAEARRQRSLSVLDRAFAIEAELPNGWRAKIAFEGPQLVVAFDPPHQITETAGGGAKAA